MTRPPVDVEPMFTISVSPLANLVTWSDTKKNKINIQKLNCKIQVHTRICLPSPSALTPNKRRSRKKLISNSVNISGSLPTSPRTFVRNSENVFFGWGEGVHTWPTSLSPRQSVGSIFVPTPMRPPGTAYWRSFRSANSVMIFEKIGTHLTLPSASFATIPGRTSISSPIWINNQNLLCLWVNEKDTFKIPWMIEPPATPPFKSSTSVPGLFTSKLRMTIKRGEEVKSRTGTGILLQMYSQMTSMLYFNCAEIGIMGASCAMVPNIVKIVG